MSNELAVKNATGTLTIRSMDDLARLGNMLAASGYFTDARDAAQAGVKVLAGLEMGIGAFSAMSGIHVIEGKPSVGAGLMAAAVKRSEKYDYRVTKHTETECSIDFFENAEPCGTSTFTVADAKKAGLKFTTSSGKPTGWTKNPKNMLFARALSNGVRWYCPDVFSASTYTPEELGADVDGEGNIIAVETVEPPKVTKAKKVEPETVETAAAKSEPVDSPAEPTDPDAEFPPEPDFEVTAPIKASDASTITAALAPLKLSRDDARRVVSSVADRDVTTIKDLTRDEGELLAALTTDQWGEALDLLREPA